MKNASWVLGKVVGLNFFYRHVDRHDLCAIHVYPHGDSTDHNCRDHGQSGHVHHDPVGISLERSLDCPIYVYVGRQNTMTSLQVGGTVR